MSKSSQWLMILAVAIALHGCTIEPAGCLHLKAGIEDHHLIVEETLEVARVMNLKVLRQVDQMTGPDHPDFLIELRGRGSYVIVRHGIGDPWVCAYGFRSKRPLEVLEEFETRLESAGIELFGK